MICPHCGAVFCPEDPGQAYCCRAHKRRAAEKRRLRRRWAAIPCAAKARYPDARAASAALARVSGTEGHRERGWYACPRCHGYHLTGRPLSTPGETPGNV